MSLYDKSTPRICNTCRYWVAMSAEKAGPEIKAPCVCATSPNYGQSTSKFTGCNEHKIGGGQS